MTPFTSEEVSNFRFQLIDRLGAIKEFIDRYGEDKFYLSFSCGKDSCVLDWMLDATLPNNKIPRVFINTGIEYREIVAFFNRRKSADERFMEIKPGVNIRQMLTRQGYPFKSKEHSVKVRMFQNGSQAKTLKKYMEGDPFGCPKQLMYQFQGDGLPFKVSDVCCKELKKNPAHEYEKASGRTIAILGLRQEEGGQRGNHSGCVVYQRKAPKKFKPLNPVTRRFEDWLIQDNSIRLPDLYYKPFCFKRTGCKGCPYSIDLQDELDAMRENDLFADLCQCEAIFKPVYDEYRRIGYRLRKDEK